MKSAAILRISKPVFDRLEGLLLSRYPDAEWMTFFRFGWTLQAGVLVLSIASLDEPQQDDLDREVLHVSIQEPYSLRAVLAASEQPLALGVVHSHPEGCATIPSTIDDDMDAYYSEYFSSFLDDRPYASLIYSKNANGRRSLSGRAWWRSQQYQLGKTAVVGESLQFIWPRSAGSSPPVSVAKRTKRAADTYGADAMRRLWNSKVAVVGLGGTGSAAAHVLARAGVGNLVFIDCDILDSTNIERVHGSYAEDAATGRAKVQIARELAHKICPEMSVTAIEGNCLQPLAREHLLNADLILSCTDTQHSRVGLAELAYRYGVPVIDVAVQLDGTSGVVNSETIQLARYEPNLPCPYCRDLVDQWRLAAELMSDDERARRRQEARDAVARGERPDPYWKGDAPQILTVGHLTTTAGAMAASYGIGMLSGTSKMPAAFFQVDILKEGFSFAAVNIDSLPHCPCSETQCHADQAAHRSAISAPPHWPPARVVAPEE